MIPANDSEAKELVGISLRQPRMVRRIQDSAGVNTVFRQILEPITLTPVEKDGKGFYRASGTARGAEMLDRLGLTRAVDFGGCGGVQSSILTTLTFEVDLVSLETWTF